MTNRATKWAWEGVSWVGIGVVCSLVGCSWLGGSKSKNEQSLQAETSSGASANQEGDAEEIIFAGLSGNPPRFIDSGPLRGMGWQEEETREIRKGLRDAGFKLKMEYMTPARIEHEFQSHHPICTYPVEWKDPEKTFSQAPDRIYSIALQLGGEVTRSIIINKADASKFSKHRKANGNIDIDSLLSDSSLKTLMIRDKDYGRLTRKVLESTEAGEQGVKPEYQKNINLLVIRDNRQVIEMLNANRFDYYFAEGIEELDLKASGLDRSKFDEIRYDTGAVEDIRDPSLVRVSIACARHPLTVRAMPYFNHWIKLHRGQRWVERKYNYRKKFDEHFAKFFPPASIATTVRFSEELRFGLEEQWYPKQQKWVSGLALFPTPEAALRGGEVKGLRSDLQVRKKPLHWRSFVLPPSVGAKANPGSRVVFMSEGDGRWLRGKQEFGGFFDGLNSSLRVFFLFGLADLAAFSEGIEKLVQHDQLSQLFEEGVTRAEVRKIALPVNTTELTLFAAGLTPQDLTGILTQISDLPLTEFSLIDGGVDTSKALIASLPKTVQRLRFSRSSLVESDLTEKLQTMPLSELSLISAQLREEETSRLLKNLPPTLEVFRFTHGSFFKDSLLKDSPLSGVQRLAQLKVLDLTDMNLTNQHLTWIAKVIPNSIEVLRLGENLLTLDGLRRFFSGSFGSLRELDLSSLQSRTRSGAFPGTTAAGVPSPGLIKPLKLPEQIEKLSLRSRWLTAGNFRAIRLPKKLIWADFGGNSIGDEGALSILSRLASSVEFLDLSQTGITKRSIQELVSSQNFKEITELNLASNPIDDVAIAPLKAAQFSVKRLDLSSTLITGQGLSSLSGVLARGVEVLNLSETLLNEAGTRTLAGLLPSSLRGLALDAILGIDFDALAKSLPARLSALSLSENQVTDSELRILSPKLSPSLSALGLVGSALSDAGVATLVQALPLLVRLKMSASSVTSLGLEKLVLGLPAFLKVFQVRVGLPGRLLESLKEQFPGLSYLALNTNFDPASTQRLVQSLPPSLVVFYLADSSFSPSDLGLLFENAPRNLRFLQAIGQGTADARIHLEKVPKTVVDLRMSFTNIGRADWDALKTASFENTVRLDQLQGFHFVGVYRKCVFGKESWNALELSARQLRSIAIEHCRVEGNSLDFLGPITLGSLRSLNLQSADLTGSQLRRILPRLKKDFTGISLKSNFLTDEDVPYLISQLPIHLQRLVVTGNKIGQNGLDLLKSLQAKREMDEDGGFELVE